MNFQECRHCFGLNDDDILDDQIHSVARVELHSLVDDRDRALSGKSQLARAQLELQAAAVCGFEQAGTERPMDLDRRRQDLASDGVERCVDEHAERQSNFRAQP